MSVKFMQRGQYGKAAGINVLRQRLIYIISVSQVEIMNAYMVFYRYIALSSYTFP